MTKMPKYDVTEVEQTLIDQIPPAVATGDVDRMITVFKRLYLDEEYRDCLSAMMIIEKYLFRAWELFYFVGERSADFDYEEFFFDEEAHSHVLSAARDRLDAERAEEDFLAGRALVAEGDPIRAAEYFEKSAKGGNVAGAFNYGVTLYRGEGCPRDPLMAAFWYFIAAVGGDYRAMVNLAEQFRAGEGVCADEMTMLYWYIQAYLHGDERALLTVATLLSRGEGVPGLERLGQTILVILGQGKDDPEGFRRTLRGIRMRLEPYIYNRKFL